MSEMINVRLMSEQDIELGLSLTQAAGWNQKEADWKRFVKLAPTGCFVGELGGEACGTAVALTLGGVGWIAMILVAPAARGRGLGRALTTHALQYLEAAGVRTVRLDATPLGEPIYKRLGFAGEYGLKRYRSVAVKASDESPSHSTSDDFKLRALKPSDMTHVVEFDRSATGTKRDALLNDLLLCSGNPAWGAWSGAKLLGYATVRPGRNAWHIGPIVVGDSAVGGALFHAVAVAVAGQPAVVDIPNQNERALKEAQSHGFVVERPYLRMCHGERITDDPSALWASAGPEKG